MFDQYKNKTKIKKEVSFVSVALDYISQAAKWTSQQEI